MSLKQLFIAVAFLLFSMPVFSSADPIKTFVTEFSISGMPNRDELKTTLQRVLASRLDQSRMQIVESADKAELVLSGSYAMIGKVFSLDLNIKSTKTGIINVVYEQGEGQDDLIMAVGRLAKKVAGQISSAGTVVKPNDLKTGTTQKSAYVVHETVNSDSNTDGWSSEPLAGVYNSIALGRTFKSGEREIFVASDNSISLFHKGSALKQITKIDLPVSSKILAIDTADLDHDGIPELYVTTMDRGALASRIYQPKDSGLSVIAENLPWFFRGEGNDLKSRIIFAQKMTTKGEYYNGIDELIKNGNRFETGKTRKLPSSGNIFNFTRFRDTSGAEKGLMLNADNRLAVSNPDGKVLWTSSDKYGGSETLFKHEVDAPSSAMGGHLDMHFLEQRITVFANGIIMVPTNDGLYSVGYSRSYNKHMFHALKWTGSVFKEVWHTQSMPSYLADYTYDSTSSELVKLEVVQKAGLFGDGSSVITINKIE